VTVFRDYALFDPMEFGSDMWMRRWDEKLLALVSLDDLDGFEELWTCGEEDYEGKDYDIRSYPVEKRKIMMTDPVDSLGTTKVKIDLYHGQVIGEVDVHVSAKN